MLFNSYIFLIFLLLVLPIYYSLGKKEHRNLFLLAASYFFYGYWDVTFCGLLALSTVIDFNIGKALYKVKEAKIRQRYVQLSLFTNLGILAIFKYCNFFIDSFEALAAGFGAHLDDLHLNILLPVGISFYTFQTLSYTIDIYRKRLEPTDNFIDFALFVSFFPQLVAGPIERAKHLLPQISKSPLPDKVQINKGIELIITGLFKKVMIGDTVGRYVDHIFGEQMHYTASELIFALFLFSIQIYADFSGYSRIARGTAKLLGIELMKNFETPYLSSNITEFWRRWHISLSSWLKDYLYISLGGNRHGQFRTYINLMITMLLGGLWHGASWNFVIWGALHGLYLSIHKLMLRGGKPSVRYSYNGVAGFLLHSSKVLSTFILVLFTWLFFRLSSFEETVFFFQKVANWESSEHLHQLFSIAISYTLLLLTFDIAEYYTKRHTFMIELFSPAVRAGVLTTLLSVVLLYLLVSEPAPFVYFQF